MTPTPSIRTTLRCVGLLLGLCLAALVAAQEAPGSLLRIPTRDGVHATLFWQPAPGAQATVLLFPGGDGGFGAVEAGRATGQNFLVRSAPQWAAQGFNVAIFGRPSDRTALGWDERLEPAHLADIRQALRAVKERSSAPVWLVGTSRGTVSATAFAIAHQDEVAGLVLTASVTSHRKAGAVPRQNLAALRLPVLVLHHQRDACVLCQPHEVPNILRGLTQARAKKLLMVDGGAGPTGDPCKGQHWHGFIGMEAEAVRLMAEWMRDPRP